MRAQPLWHYSVSPTRYNYDCLDTSYIEPWTISTTTLSQTQLHFETNWSKNQSVLFISNLFALRHIDAVGNSIQLCDKQQPKHHITFTFKFTQDLFTRIVSRHRLFWAGSSKFGALHYIKGNPPHVQLLCKRRTSRCGDNYVLPSSQNPYQPYLWRILLHIWLQPFIPQMIISLSLTFSSLHCFFTPLHLLFLTISSSWYLFIHPPSIDVWISFAVLSFYLMAYWKTSVVR